MKTIKLLAIAIIFSFAATTQAQTAEEIVSNYLENTGGVDAWNKLESLQMNAVVNQGFDIPVTIIQMKDGRQAIKINLQGQEITQLAFDGEVAWVTNFQTQKAEKMDAETIETFKTIAGKAFPSPFLNYKEKGHTIALLGEEIIDGTNTFKVEITMDPITIDGKEVENKSVYYFEDENFVPIQTASEVNQGPTKGQIAKESFSDYEEVNGLYFPFAITFGGQPVDIKSIEVNPKIDDSVFKMPTQ